jgi:hypothetical protein
LNIDISTPALLFPAISLLLLAYTNRYLSLAAVVRNLSERMDTMPTASRRRQARNLADRIFLIRYMQLCGVLSIFLCVLSMTCLWASWLQLGNVIFALSLLAMAVSLAISFVEVFRSGAALSMELEDMEQRCLEAEGSKL